MSGKIGLLGWAVEFEGLDPASKLVLLLAANAADMDGRVFNLDRLQRLANLTDSGFAEAVAELSSIGIASFVSATQPSTGEKRRCLEIFAEEIAG